MLGLSPVAALPLASALNETPNVLLASMGPYVLTGNAVTLYATRKIVPATGSYTLTGQTVNFWRSLSPAALGKLFLTGTNNNRRFGPAMIQNFEMTAGDTKTLVVTVKDSNDDAVAITGAAIKWQCARSFGKASSISKATGGSGIVITDGPNGQFTVTLDADDTEDLVGNFYHEAQVTATDDTVSTVLFGTHEDQ